MKIINTVLLFVVLNSCKTGNQEADIIYFNGKIWTGDSSLPWAEVIGLKGNKIIYTGKNIDSFKTNKTRMVDLQGMLVVPGFIDNHTHFLSGGFQLASVDLKAAQTPQEFISIMKEFCDRHPDDRWIQGGNWDHEAWGGKLPEKEWIDSVTGNHPVF